MKMKGLKTARVVVIDDEVEEALPLICVLSQIGIGSVYFNGDIDQLPDAPLKGIRVVFLDLRLMGGPAVEAKQYIPQTLSVLAKVVEAKPGITGIVCWTKYEEDVEELEKRLPQAIPGFHPAFLLPIKDKSRFLKKNNDGAVALQNEIKCVLGSHHAQCLLWEWEQSVHNAASGTTILLSDVTATENGNLNDNLLNLLAVLSYASGGKTITDTTSSVKHLFEGLNPLHYDQLEQDAHTGSVNGPHAEALKGKINGRTALSPAQRSHLNRILLTSEVSAGEVSPHPGNVYVAAGWNADVDDSFPFATNDANIKVFMDNLWSHPGNNRLDELVKASVPCLLEITPACDYATGKVRCARLVGGVLISSTGTERNDNKKRKLPAESRMFAKQTEFLRVENSDMGLEGSFSLIVNARYFYSMPLEKLKMHKPVFRLRHQVVSDIRAWFASHAARPGYLSVR